MVLPAKLPCRGERIAVRTCRGRGRGDSAPGCCRPARLLVAVLLCGLILHGSELSQLAQIDGASGDEQRVIEFVRGRVGGNQRTGANGSLVATFGHGRPRTLLIAGVDEPGFAVSRIDDHGYLWLHALADIGGVSGLEARFRGRHVRVSTRAGLAVPGIVAVPSVHFQRIPGSSASRAPSGLLVDVGASTRHEAESAGIGLLDRVSLDKRAVRLPDRRIAAPWISSRVGAAILLEFGRRLEAGRAAGTVILVFATRQYPRNGGMARAVRSIETDRVVVIAPNGGPRATVAPASGSGPDESQTYLDLAGQVGLRLERRASHTIRFGAFGDPSPWMPGQPVTVLVPPVRNGGTPAESVSQEEIGLITSLLSLSVGLSGQESPAGPSGEEGAAAGQPAVHKTRNWLEKTIAALVHEPGVSGAEARVRTRIRDLLPSGVADGARVDSKGNLIVRVGSAGVPSAAFIAHMDEIGYEIRNLLADGTASVSSKGGGLPDVFVWQRMSVHAAQSTIPAVMSNSGRLDFGGVSGQQLQALGVRAGNTATLQKRYAKLLGYRIAGRSLDDRLGCAVLLEVLRRVSSKARRARGAVDFVFSVEEETGLRGARHYMQSIRPRRVYPVDTFVTSDSPFGLERLAPAVLGAGAVLRAVDQSSVTPLREVERVLTIARRARIPVQLGVTAGGNDGSVFKYLETVNVPIGFPLRYAHSPVETADLRDAASVANLVEALALVDLGLRR